MSTEKLQNETTSANIQEKVGGSSCSDGKNEVRKSIRSKKPKQIFTPEEVLRRKKKRKNTAPDRAYDTLPDGKPFSCDLCKSPYVINQSSKRALKDKRSRHVPDPKQKVDPWTGKILLLCNSCAWTFDGALRPKKTGQLVVSAEDKAQYLDKVRSESKALAEKYQIPEAERFYCPTFVRKRCKCIQKYFTSDVDEDTTRKRMREFVELYNEAKSLSQQKAYIPIPVPNASGRRTKKIKNLIPIGLGNGHKRSHAFTVFVLGKRRYLKEEIGLCERGTQRVLLYSNNFLHKKLKTEQSECRVKPLKGKAKLGLLETFDDMSKKRCCVDNCVMMALTHRKLLQQWRERASTGQTNARRVIAEMLTPSAGARCNCYNFITRVTGSSRSTIVQVNHQMLKTGGEREPPLHGLKKFWQGSKKQEEGCRTSVNELAESTSKSETVTSSVTTQQEMTSSTVNLVPNLVNLDLMQQQQLLQLQQQMFDQQLQLQQQHHSLQQHLLQHSMLQHIGGTDNTSQSLGLIQQMIEQLNVQIHNTQTQLQQSLEHLHNMTYSVQQNILQSQLITSSKLPLQQLAVGSHLTLPQVAAGSQLTLPQVATGSQLPLPQVATGSQLPLPQFATGPVMQVPQLTTGAQLTLPHVAAGSQMILSQIGTGSQLQLPKTGSQNIMLSSPQNQPNINLKLPTENSTPNSSSQIFTGHLPSQTVGIYGPLPVDQLLSNAAGSQLNELENTAGQKEQQSGMPAGQTLAVTGGEVVQEPQCKTVHISNTQPGKPILTSQNQALSVQPAEHSDGSQVHQSHNAIALQEQPFLQISQSRETGNLHSQYEDSSQSQQLQGELSSSNSQIKLPLNSLTQLSTSSHSQSLQNQNQVYKQVSSSLIQPTHSQMLAQVSTSLIRPTQNQMHKQVSASLIQPTQNQVQKHVSASLIQPTQSQMLTSLLQPTQSQVHKQVSAALIQPAASQISTQVSASQTKNQLFQPLTQSHVFQQLPSPFVKPNPKQMLRQVSVSPVQLKQNQVFTQICNPNVQTDLQTSNHQNPSFIKVTPPRGPIQHITQPQVQQLNPSVFPVPANNLGQGQGQTIQVQFIQPETTDLSTSDESVTPVKVYEPHLITNTQQHVVSQPTFTVQNVQKSSSEKDGKNECQSQVQVQGHMQQENQSRSQFLSINEIVSLQILKQMQGTSNVTSLGKQNNTDENSIKSSGSPNVMKKAANIQQANIEPRSSSNMTKQGKSIQEAVIEPSSSPTVNKQGTSILQADIESRSSPIITKQGTRIKQACVESRISSGTEKQGRSIQPGDTESSSFSRILKQGTSIQPANVEQLILPVRFIGKHCENGIGHNQSPKGAVGNGCCTTSSMAGSETVTPSNNHPQLSQCTTSSTVRSETVTPSNNHPRLSQCTTSSTVRSQSVTPSYNHPQLSWCTKGCTVRSQTVAPSYNHHQLSQCATSSTVRSQTVAPSYSHPQLLQCTTSSSVRSETVSPSYNNPQLTQCANSSMVRSETVTPSYNHPQLPQCATSSTVRSQTVAPSYNHPQALQCTASSSVGSETVSPSYNRPQLLQCTTSSSVGSETVSPSYNYPQLLQCTTSSSVRSQTVAPSYNRPQLLQCTTSSSVQSETVTPSSLVQSETVTPSYNHPQLSQLLSSMKTTSNLPGKIQNTSKLTSNVQQQTFIPIVSPHTYETNLARSKFNSLHVPSNSAQLNNYIEHVQNIPPRQSLSGTSQNGGTMSFSQIERFRTQLQTSTQTQLANHPHLLVTPSVDVGLQQPRANHPHLLVAPSVDISLQQPCFTRQQIITLPQQPVSLASEVTNQQLGQTLQPQMITQPQMNGSPSSHSIQLTKPQALTQPQIPVAPSNCSNNQLATSSCDQHGLSTQPHIATEQVLVVPSSGDIHQKHGQSSQPHITTQPQIFVVPSSSSINQKLGQSTQQHITVQPQLLVAPSSGINKQFEQLTHPHIITQPQILLAPPGSSTNQQHLQSTQSPITTQQQILVTPPGDAINQQHSHSTHPHIITQPQIFVPPNNQQDRQSVQPHIASQPQMLIAPNDGTNQHGKLTQQQINMQPQIIIAPSGGEIAQQQQGRPLKLNIQLQTNSPQDITNVLQLLQKSDLSQLQSSVGHVTVNLNPSQPVQAGFQNVLKPIQTSQATYTEPVSYGDTYHSYTPIVSLSGENKGNNPQHQTSAFSRVNRRVPENEIYNHPRGGPKKHNINISSEANNSQEIDISKSDTIATGIQNKQNVTKLNTSDDSYDYTFEMSDSRSPGKQLRTNMHSGRPKTLNSDIVPGISQRIMDNIQGQSSVHSFQGMRQMDNFQGNRPFDKIQSQISVDNIQGQMPINENQSHLSVDKNQGQCVQGSLHNANVVQGIIQGQNMLNSLPVNCTLVLNPNLNSVGNAVLSDKGD